MIEASAMRSGLTKKAGIALMIGAVISMFRVLPIVLSNGVTGDNFPPESVDEIVFFSQLQGWHVSHVLLLVLLPLLVFGVAVLARDVAGSGQASAGLMALIGTSFSTMLFFVATVLDGFVLPVVTDGVAVGGAISDSSAAGLATFTHETASIFGGTASALLLITATFIGIGLARGLESPKLGAIGIGIGVISTIGYLSGILDLNISDGFDRVGPVLMAMFVYLFAVGVATLRRGASGHRSLV